MLLVLRFFSEQDHEIFQAGIAMGRERCSCPISVAGNPIAVCL
jgi:hypothetical protein